MVPSLFSSFHTLLRVADREFQWPFFLKGKNPLARLTHHGRLWARRSGLRYRLGTRGNAPTWPRRIEDALDLHQT